MSGPGGQPPNLTQQQLMALQQQQQMRHMQQQQQHQHQMQQQQMMQQRQHQLQHQGQSPFPRARTPQQLQPHPPGGSPGSHLQMHPHLQSQGHLQPRSPLVASGGPGSVGNPTTPQMMQQPMGMNQPMSLPPSTHISRPGSVAPPSSVPANIHNSGGPPLEHQQQYPMHLQPQQTPSRPNSQMSQHLSGGSGGGPQSVQRPGSVLAPGSVQPGSHGPLSHSAGGPQSVQGYGPGPGSVQPSSVQPASVQPPGSQQAPLSVQQPGSFAPGSVQPPPSNQPPSSVQPPPSAASATSAAPGKIEPLKPNEEQIRMVQDPVDLVRNLVQKDLRNSLVEMNKRGADLVKKKSEEGGMTEADKAQYKRAANDFHAVCDEIDRTLTTVMETAKQLSKLDKVFIDRSSKDLDGEVMVNCVQQFVDNTEIVQKMFDDTIGSVTANMEKIRRRQKKWEELQKKKRAEEDVEMTE